MLMKNSIIKSKRIYYYFGFIFIITIWVISSLIVDNDIILPRIDSVLKELWVLLSKNSTYKIIFNTLSRLVLTVLISFLLSVILSLLSLLSKRFKNFFDAIVTIIKTLPVATIIVILLIIFGGSKSPLIITGFVVFPLQYEAIYTSFKTIDKDIIDEISMISNINLQIIKDVFIPIKGPNILSSILSSVGLGLKTMVMAEFIAQPRNTIGREILYNKEMLEMARVFSWTIILIVLVVLIDFTVKKIKYLNN